MSSFIKRVLALELMESRFFTKTLFLIIPYFVLLAYLLIPLIYNLLVYHASLLNYPYQLEYRENSMLVITDAFMNLINPFKLENSPELSNQYGYVYNFFAVISSNFFGVTFLSHRLVSGAAIIISTIVGMRLVFQITKSIILTLSSGVIIYSSILYSFTSISRPDALGFLFFVLSIYFAWVNNFTKKGLIISILFGILAFYTKVYFVIAVPIILSFTFFFISKKRGFVFSLLFFITFVVTGVLTDLVFPTYFREILLNIPIVKSEAQFFLELNFFYLDYRYLIFLWSFLVAMFWLKILSSHVQHNRRLVQKGMLAFIKEQLVLDKNVLFFNYCLLICSLATLMMIGHMGMIRTYIKHLVIFPLILSCVSLMFTHKKNSLNFLFVFLLIGFVLASNNLKDPFLKPISASYQSQEWESFAHLLQGKESVYSSSPLGGSLLLEQGFTVYNSGLSEYFSYGLNNDIFIKKFLSPSDEMVENKYANYQQVLREKISRKGFDLIISNSAVPPSNEYKLVNSITITTPSHIPQKNTVYFWE